MSAPLFENIALRCVLLVITTIIHAARMTGALRVLRPGFWKSWKLGRQAINAVLVVLLVPMMFFASLLEIGAWAPLYMAEGAFSELEPAFYYSAVTFTTLGYGDIVLEDKWRLLGSFQTAVGIIMFGWTTALIYAFVLRLYFQSTLHDQEPH
jgi:hypothetical protein